MVARFCLPCFNWDRGTETANGAATDLRLMERQFFYRDRRHPSRSNLQSVMRCEPPGEAERARTEVAMPRQSLDAGVSILAQLDAVVADRVLLFGSLPPHGRDLDLLVRRDRERRTIINWLEQHDFEPRGNRWARFDTAAAAVVEVIPATALQLPAAEIDALYAEAERLLAMRNVARPSAAHSLLILARKRTWRGNTISDSHRSRINAAIEADPRVWARAEAGAAAWKLSASLSCLCAAYSRKRPDLRTRASALAEATARAGNGSSFAGARKGARRFLGAKRGKLFALSGLDGAGKSLQAATLAQTLDVFGRNAVVVWSPLGSAGIIASLGNWGKRIVSVTSAPAAAISPAPVSANEHHLVSRTWVVLMSLADAVTQLRTATKLLRGRDVICDRYALDSAVHLLHRYGDTRLVRFQVALISLLSPRPRRAFFLDVRPEVALARKTDRWTEGELRERLDLYRELRTAYGATLVDGEQHRDRVAAEIARDVWRSLP
jgi:thymidylate kinase